jgi:murein DD-endopeptidase MepM/ murein hydrolase activator NlpD
MRGGITVNGGGVCCSPKQSRFVLYLVEMETSIRNTGAVLFFIVGLFTSVCFYVYPVHGADSSISNLTNDQQSEIDDRQKKISEINAKIKAYEKIIDLKKVQGATLSDQIEALEAQVSKLELEIRAMEQRASEISVELTDVNSKILEKERVIGRERLVLSELIREYYAGSDDGSGIMLAAVGNDADFLMKRDDWMAETNGRIVSILRDMAATKKSMEEEQSVLTVKKIEADSLKNQLGQKSDELESAQKNKAALLAKTQTEQTRYSSLVDTLEEQRKQIENEIGDLESGLSVGEDIPSSKNGLLNYPLKSPQITQGYGKTSFSKNAYASGKHNGVDFGVSSGTTIMAAGGGTVIGVGSSGKYAYGKWVAIDHGNGLVTLYGHLSVQSVKKGQKVSNGDKIGLSGNTGYSTGPHLHFSVFSSSSYKVVESSKVGGVYYPIGASVNPMNYL